MKPPIFLTALLLLTKGCELLAQRVDCFTQSSTQSSPGLYTASYVQPTGQISIPAVITPVVSSTEPTPVPAQFVSSYSDYRNYPFMPPSMPPIIITRDDDDDWYHLMYFLILALSKNRDRGCGYAYNNDNCGCGGNFGCCCGGNGCGGNNCGGNNRGGNNYGGNNYGGNNYVGNDCSGYSYGNNGYGDYGYDNYGGGGDSSGYGYSGVSVYDSIANYGENNINNSGKEIRYIPFPIAVPMNIPYSLPSFSYPDDTPSTPDFIPSPASALPPCNCNCGDSNEVFLTIRTSDCQ